MPTTLVEIFRDNETHHRLSLFDLPDLNAIEAGLVEKNGKPYLKCLATDKDRPAKPEEIVRQFWIHKLISHVVPGEEAPSRATWIVQPGDVITSTVRPIRCLTGLIEPEQAENICSSGFAVLTPKGIPGELLFAYLRLPVICELMDLHTTASMYPAISTTDLMRLPFLLPDDATIKKVKQLITASRLARREAHALLEKAKQAVEIAIEKNEAAGMAILRS
jgi:hypothetical protein